MIYTSNDIFTFGEYNGQYVERIVLVDPAYIENAIATIPGFCLDDDLKTLLYQVRNNELLEDPEYS